ncbi:MAG: hypothetical protein QXT73_05660 [Candidatus Methanomethylicaceae archaeon]
MPIHITIDESGSLNCFFTFSRWRELKRLAEKKFKMPVDDLARAVLWQFVERCTEKDGKDKSGRLKTAQRRGCSRGKWEQRPGH